MDNSRKTITKPSDKQCKKCGISIQDPIRGRKRIWCKACTKNRKDEKDKKRIMAKRLQKKLQENLGIMNYDELKKLTDAYDEAKKEESTINSFIPNNLIELPFGVSMDAYEKKTYSKNEIDDMIDKRLTIFMKSLLKQGRLKHQ
jgi:hypothetical protein